MRAVGLALLLAIAACGDDESAPPPPDDPVPGGDPTLRLVALGTHYSGEVIPFDVPAGASGITLYAEFPLHSGFETLTAPGGAQLIQQAGIPGTAALFRAAPTFTNTPAPYGVAAAVPQSDAAGALPLAVGGWQLVLRDQIGTGVQVPDVRLVVRVPDAALANTIDVNAFLAPATIEQGDMQDVLAQAFADFAGIALGKVAFFELPAAAATIDGEEEFRALLNGTSVAGTAPALNVLVVSDMSALLADGKAGWTPGLTLWHGTDVSGLAIEVSSDRAYMALRLRHEAGHLAGLLHTTEMDEGLADALADTPVCSNTAMLDACPDAANLMFPIPNEVWGGTLSGAQQQVIMASAFYRSSEMVAQSAQGLSIADVGGWGDGEMGGEAPPHPPSSPSPHISGARVMAAVASPCGESAERALRVAWTDEELAELRTIGADATVPRHARRRALAISSASLLGPSTTH